ncbi:hypothetical protein [Salinisphaera sp.]|uniref:hypothetical protein n=1 Tax=Salinisphaera sp. TaxID=1914330 RepID=UPI0025CBED27|nr:hypothetical protein [Salinisphaera sp.]
MPSLNRVPLLFPVVLVLQGCSYALVPETSDPLRKIDQAYQMWSVGRWVPAEGLGREALAMAEQSGDPVAIANSHRYLGNFYKSGLYREHAQWFAEQGRYDPTSGLSIFHFEKAEQTWASIDNHVGMALDQFNQGVAYSIDDDHEKTCERYATALDTYESAHEEFANTKLPISSHFKDFPEMIDAFSEEENCENL